MPTFCLPNLSFSRLVIIFVSLFSAIILIVTAWIYFQPDCSAANFHPHASYNAVNTQTVADGISQFSTDFYTAAKTAGNGTSRNWVFSPFSLSTVFAMLKVGTRGETSRQLERAFHFSHCDTTHVSGFYSTLQTLNGVESSPDFTITSANRMYIDNSFEVLPSYLTILETWFGSGIERLKLNPAAASVINKWVENVTHNKIQDLISPEDLDDSNPSFRPVFVVVNAIYMLGKWKYQFQKKDTRNKNVYLSDRADDFVKVKMMHQDLTIQATYLKDIDADVFLLPYKGDRFSMLVFLPHTRDGLSKVESNLKSIPSLSQLKPQFRATAVNLAFPRFRIETTIDATKILPKLGVTLIFSDKGEGDFTGMIDTTKEVERLKVSKAVQKAVIAVDEEGTEAAAATAFSGFVVTSYKEPYPVKLTVDHPFYYQIVDAENSDMVLFAGSCTNPSQTN